jgi:hypothetical protein
MSSRTMQGGMQMSASFLTKAALSLAVVGAAVVPMSGTSFAASNTGTITQYDLNNTVNAGQGFGRYACVQMSPALPTVGNACVYGNPLYKEQDETLLQAYLLKKTCRIEWSATDTDGYAVITTVHCQ